MPKPSSGPESTRVQVRRKTSRSAAHRILLHAIGILALGTLPSRATATASISALVSGPPAVEALTGPTSRPPGFLDISARHGNHGHEDEEEEMEEHKQHAPSQEHSAESSAPISQPNAPSEHTHSNIHGHSHSHERPSQPAQSTSYSNFTHDHAPFIAAEDLPDPWTAGPLLRPIPPPPPGQWGGHHHHGNAPALTEFNETALFYSKGAAPLSYVEWDMNWGPARTNELRRFVAAGEGESDGQPLMGAVDGRWRKLFDERDPARRASLNKAMKKMVEKEEPARHGRLMAAHVAGCIIACFVLLPLTLAFRAANSSLAPLSALAYLVTLFSSLLLGGLYKALTPSLFAPNSHGKMGWVLFWISSGVFALDIIRLLQQIASVFVGPRAAGSGRWRTLWSRISSSGSSYSDAIALGEYEPCHPSEARSMLRYAHAHEEGRAQKAMSLSKDIDNDERPQATPRPVQRNGSSSSSGSSGCTAAEEGHYSSPTGTLVGTPRVSLNGSQFTTPWTNSGATRSASPTSQADLRNEHELDHMEARGRGPIRQHRRGLSSISTLWEREALPKRDLAVSADEHSPASTLSLPAVKKARQTWLQALVRYAHVTVARSLPVLAFATSYTGLTVYAGACRSNTINGCAAHGIKGGIFFWFGLLTFGRYVGAYAEHGWAWNARPKPKSNGSFSVPSAEFVESLVIFLYGISNTWMERFAAKAGDPYSVKEVQHISIAVMYWFAGMLGMLIEMGWTKRLLGLPIVLTHPSARQKVRTSRNGEELSTEDADEYAAELVDRQRAPPSYAGSFNPFPALCIGVTGVAMAAHHQDYVYEVQVHALWGNLLASFAILRCLTYFFLYLRPATASILPGRPPTEALAALALTCGGMVFMLSSEEVSFLAMRTGWSDIMMISNVTVAVVCLLFCGIAGMFIIKAWAVKRELRKSGRGQGRMPASRARGADVAGTATRRASMTAVSPTSASVSVFIVGDEEGEDEEMMGTTVRSAAEHDAMRNGSFRF
ncbi:hypothetical protein A4X13_0g4977 [Tilletia indica]|uniref:Protein YTP1-like C-terminal domain-containing protein n=1 Tax=Tilletia indica TaxID=43049 RepID=A0A177TY47_9BASI|nr:hypothetical protein A4X13_0g4977 [Tilletia indica]